MEKQPEIRNASIEELTPQGGMSSGSANLELVMSVDIDISVEIGRTRMPIRDLLGMAPGSVIELAKIAGEPADVYANGHKIASGEIVVVDENFGVRITEIVPAAARVAVGS
jgi:flagellar motor switch protein FliN/FliY